MKKLLFVIVAMGLVVAGYCMSSDSPETVASESGVIVKADATVESTQTTNRISLQFNGSTWDVVSEYPMATHQRVVVDGPATPGFIVDFFPGSTVAPTNYYADILTIAEILPGSDNTYIYTF